VRGNLVSQIIGIILFRKVNAVAIFVGEELKWSMEWIIKRLIKIGERVSCKGRKWYAHVASNFPLIDIAASCSRL